MDEEFDKLSSELLKELENIGLYPLVPLQFGAVPHSGFEDAVIKAEDGDPLDMMRSGIADFFCHGAFRVGDVAFSQRVLDPASHESDVQFDQIVHTAREQLEELRKQELENPDDLDDDDL